VSPPEPAQNENSEPASKGKKRSLKGKKSSEPAKKKNKKCARCKEEVDTVEKCDQCYSKFCSVHIAYGTYGAVCVNCCLFHKVSDEVSNLYLEKMNIS
jgi:hypothetical protein